MQASLNSLCTLFFFFHSRFQQKKKKKTHKLEVKKVFDSIACDDKQLKSVTKS